MVYGSEAVLPSELNYGSPRTRAYQPASFEEAQQDAVDVLEEARDSAVKRSAKYQQALRRYHARRVHSRAFQVGDLVLRRVQTKQGKHKLSPP